MSKNLSLHLSNENAIRYLSSGDNKALIGITPKNQNSNSFKSPLKPSFVLNKSPFQSPSSLYQKAGLGVNHLKSPNERKQSMMISMDQEYQENIYFDNKSIVNNTRRDLNIGISTPQAGAKSQKNASISQKAGSALSKVSKSNKVSFYKYEPTIKKSGERSYEPTVSSQLQLNTTLAKENISYNNRQAPNTAKKELPFNKKASLPTNLKLTLDKIYTKDGSSSHRIHLNSPKSDTSTNLCASTSVHRRNGKSVALDVKPKTTTHAEQMNIKESNSKNKLNILLVGLSKPSPSHNASTANLIPKLNVRDINSMQVTPRKDISDIVQLEEPEEEETDSSKRYKQLLVLLKEKNNEIRRLSKDKLELKSTLNAVGEELGSLNKIKALFTDKGKNLSNFQLDLNDIALEEWEQATTQPSKKGRLSQDFSRNLLQSRYTSQRSMCNLSIGDAKEAITPKSILNTSQSNAETGSDRLKKALAGGLGKKVSQAKKSEKVQTSTDLLQIPGERSYMSMSPYESNRLVGGNKSCKNSNKNSLQIVEYGLNERANSLANVEALKLKKGENKFQEAQYNKERARSMNQNLQKNSLSQSNSKSKNVYGIAPKSSVENVKKINNSINSANDISIDVGILKRKHSHDLNYNLEKTQNLLKRKHSEVKNMSTAESKKEPGQLDIGKALGDLKNRIAGLLSKRTEDGDKKLQLVQSIQKAFMGGDF